MYDRFLERLSKSKYIDNFVLKGGFYLSTLFGIEDRSTMDIDTAFRNDNFDEKTIVKMIKEEIKSNFRPFSLAFDELVVTIQEYD